MLTPKHKRGSPMTTPSQLDRMIQLGVERVVARACREEIVVELNVFSQVIFRTCIGFKALGAIAIVLFRVDSLFDFAVKCVGVGYIFFDKDRFKRAFWDASTTIDARIGVNIEPRPFALRLAAHNAFNRADFHTSAITQAQASDNVSHGVQLSPYNSEITAAYFKVNSSLNRTCIIAKRKFRSTILNRLINAHQSSELSHKIQIFLRQRSLQYICILTNDRGYITVNRVFQVAFFVLLAGVLLLAPTHNPSAAQDAVPRFENRACPVDLPFTLQEGRDVVCGMLVVPENRNDPNSRTIEVAVSIVPGTAGAGSTDTTPVFLLQGGPGGSSVETFTVGSAVFLREAFGLQRDVVMIDQRGSILSNPSLGCTEVARAQLDQMTQMLPPEQEYSAARDALFECRERLISQGINLEFYNSLENAADINDLREVLGYNQINLYGVSYGSLLAMHYQRFFPDTLRSVIIDAVVPPQVNYIAELPASAEDVFDRFFQACAQDPACNADFPNLEERFANLVAELNENPVQIEIVHPETRIVYDAFVTGTRLVDVVFGSMYDTSFLPVIPRMIDDLANGNYVLLKKSFRLTTFEDTVSTGTHYSVNCREDGNFDGSTIQLEGVRDYLVDSFVWSALNYVNVCANWGVERIPTLDDPVANDVRTLVFVGEFDPIIGYTWWETVQDDLSNESVYIFPGMGHGVAFSDTCPLEILSNFLDDPASVPSPNCIRDMGIAFSPPSAGTLEDPQGRFSLLVPNGWQATPNPDGYIEITETLTGSQMYVLAVNNQDLSFGIATAVREVFPDFDGELIDFDSVNVAGEEWTLNLFEYQDDILLATGLMDQGVVYTHLVRISVFDDLDAILEATHLTLLGFDIR